MEGKNYLSSETLTSIFRTSPKDESRIINREGITMEFKESYNHGSMAQYFKAMASFANNSGGYILFGVGDRPLIILKKCGFVNRNLGLNTECCPNFFCCCPGCSHK